MSPAKWVLGKVVGSLFWGLEFKKIKKKFKFSSFSSLYADQSEILEYVCNSISLQEITHGAYGNYQLLRSEFE